LGDILLLTLEDFELNNYYHHGTLSGKLFTGLAEDMEEIEE